MISTNLTQESKWLGITSYFSHKYFKKQYIYSSKINATAKMLNFQFLQALWLPVKSCFLSRALHIFNNFFCFQMTTTYDFFFLTLGDFWKKIYKIRGSSNTPITQHTLSIYKGESKQWDNSYKRAIKVKMEFPLSINKVPPRCRSLARGSAIDGSPSGWLQKRSPLPQF